MKAIVTGGTGFIGSHLVDRLLNDGYEVTVIDHHQTGNLGHHSSNPKLKTYKTDIRNETELTKIFAGHDIVFHLAAQADIRKSLLDHKSDLDHNLIGTLCILDAMLKNNINDLAFASTSAIYGEAKVTPTPEDYLSLQTSLYGASKLSCEAFIEAYTQFSPIRAWAFRYANVIGERCRRGVIWDLVHKLLKNPTELEILGNGRQSKEYIDVKDVIEGMMIGYHRSHEKYQAFNLGLGAQTMVDMVADLIIEEMHLDNNQVVRKYTGGPRGWIGDNPVVVLSLEKIKALGWKQTVSSEEAIRRTVRWTLQEDMKEKMKETFEVERK